MSKLESDFQSKLITEIKERLPGAIVTKTDSKQIQGFPDLLILWKKHWALLECKREKNAPHRPNQDTYVYILNKMSFSRFIFPENKEEVLNDLERSFKAKRSTRVPKSK